MQGVKKLPSDTRMIASCRTRISMPPTCIMDCRTGFWMILMSQDSGILQYIRDGAKGELEWGWCVKRVNFRTWPFAPKLSKSVRVSCFAADDSWSSGWRQIQQSSISKLMQKTSSNIFLYKTWKTFSHVDNLKVQDLTNRRRVLCPTTLS